MKVFRGVSAERGRKSETEWETSSDITTCAVPRCEYKEGNSDRNTTFNSEIHGLLTTTEVNRSNLQRDKLPVT